MTWNHGTAFDDAIRCPPPLFFFTNMVCTHNLQLFYTNDRSAFTWQLLDATMIKCMCPNAEHNYIDRLNFVEDFHLISSHLFSPHFISSHISYHISSHLISSHLISYIISYHIISHHITSHHIISLTSHHIISYHMIYELSITITSLPYELSHTIYMYPCNKGSVWTSCGNPWFIAYTPYMLSTYFDTIHVD